MSDVERAAVLVANGFLYAACFLAAHLPMLASLGIGLYIAWRCDGEAMARRRARRIQRERLKVMVESAKTRAKGQNKVVTGNAGIAANSARRSKMGLRRIAATCSLRAPGGSKRVSQP